MDSEVFFKDEQVKWKGKKGLYVIECPLFSSPCAGKPNEEKVYKVGYAYQSLAVRIADYRTTTRGASPNPLAPPKFSKIKFQKITPKFPPPKSRLKNHAKLSRPKNHAKRNIRILHKNNLSKISFRLVSV